MALPTAATCFDACSPPMALDKSRVVDFPIMPRSRLYLNPAIQSGSLGRSFIFHAIAMILLIVGIATSIIAS